MCMDILHFCLDIFCIWRCNYMLYLYKLVKCLALLQEAVGRLAYNLVSLLVRTSVSFLLQ